MTAGLGVGALFGLGLWLMILAVVPARPTLGQTIARLHRTDVTPAGRRWTRRVCGRWVDHPARRADLAVLDRPADTLATQLVVAATAGLCVPLLAAGILTGSGTRLPYGVIVAAGAAGAAVAVTVVLARLGELAGRERAALGLQLGAYLDILAMLLSAGEADEQALQLAARAGNGRLFVTLERAYRDAAVAGAATLTGMRHVGARWALPELVEIADAGSLAASDGAAVRRTLMSKTRALRATQLAAEETDARLRTGKLGGPQILIAVAFIVLILYPAFAGLLTGI